MLDRETFAKVFGFNSYKDIVQASECIHKDGNVSWFVTYLPGGFFIAWDDAGWGPGQTEESAVGDTLA